MKRISLMIVMLAAFHFSHSQNVGVGVSAPTQKLDVNGNIQFSGALMPNGSAGTSGQVLISQGSGIAPVWGDGVPGQIWQTVYSSDSINLTYDGGINWYSLPGMSNTVTVPTTANGFDAFIYTDGSMQWQTNADTGAIVLITAQIGLYVDGVLTRTDIIPVFNMRNFGQGIGNWAISTVVQNISAGSHTFEAKGMVRNVGATPTDKTLTFCDPNITGKIRLSSVAVFLVRK